MKKGLTLLFLLAFLLSTLVWAQPPPPPPAPPAGGDAAPPPEEPPPPSDGALPPTPPPVTGANVTNVTAPAPTPQPTPTIDSGLEAKITSLESSIDALQQDISQINSRLDTIESQLRQPETQAPAPPRPSRLPFIILIVLNVGLLGLVIFSLVRVKKISKPLAEPEVRKPVLPSEALKTEVSGPIPTSELAEARGEVSHSSQVHPSLKNYIQSSLQSGADFEGVKKNLLAQGWPEEQIEQAHKEVGRGS